MDLQKEREAFEQHLTDTGLVEFSDYGFAVDECDEYLHEPTQVAWDSWLIGLNRAKAQAVPEWISVEDELPKDGARVLCYGRQFMCVGVFDGDDFFDPLDGQSFVKDCVTHWMQLPASPKAQEPAND